ncbi:MAG: membrane protein [Bacteroidetes bacterium HLUCCA01]|nr:MAG: membrane protein [Bacteroidetes bacterium HLUCCA01]
MLTSTQDYEFPDPESLYERQLEEASFAYLIPFVTIIGGLPLPIINLLVCLLYWRYVRKKPPFVRFHALQSLFTTIPIVLINAVVVFLLVRMFLGDLDYASWMGGYFAAAVMFNLIEFVFNIYAAINARKGRAFMFIGFGPLAYNLTDWQEVPDETF